MTAESIEAEISENVPAGTVASDCEKTDDAIRVSGIGEKEIDSGRSGDRDISVMIPAARLEGTGSEEQSHRVQKKGEAEQDSYRGQDINSEEAEYCPFCVYMKSGACGESFAEWEECINQAEKEGVNTVDQCVRVTRFLTQCMRANADYYGPILEAEKDLGGDIRDADDLEVATQQAERTEREAVEVEAGIAAEEANG